MNAKERLGHLLQNADVIPFDNTSRVVFLSDLHMKTGDVDDNFYPNRINFWSKMFSYDMDNFMIFLLGDIEDLWGDVKHEEIVLTYPALFGLFEELRGKKRFFRVEGNHDFELGYNPGYVLHNEGTGDKILVCHGHQGELLDDLLRGLDQLLVKELWTPLAKTGVQDPTSSFKHDPQEELLSSWANTTPGNISLVCGHTHRAQNEGYYWNCGAFGNHAVELVDGELSLIRIGENHEA